MFRKVLYPTDFSENSKKAIKCINALKPKEVTILHVIDEDPFDIYEELTVGIDYDVEKVKNHLINEAKRKAEKIAKEIGNAKIEVVIGEPWIEIVKRSENYDLIVLGAFGSGGILERLLGSTAEAVLRHSKCSVLVVR